jgi:hypothetical protein
MQNSKLSFISFLFSVVGYLIAHNETFFISAAIFGAATLIILELEKRNHD